MSEVSGRPGLKTYPGPWKGQMLLTCGKCQRKLKRGEDVHGLGNLKKLLKRRAKIVQAPVKLLVIKTPCLDLCPRDGVAVCTQAQITLGRCSVVRTKADADLLYAEIVADAATA